MMPRSRPATAALVARADSMGLAASVPASLRRSARRFDAAPAKGAVELTHAEVGSTPTAAIQALAARGGLVMVIGDTRFRLSLIDDAAPDAPAAALAPAPMAEPAMHYDAPSDEFDRLVLAEAKLNSGAARPVAPSVARFDDDDGPSDPELAAACARLAGAEDRLNGARR